MLPLTRESTLKKPVMLTNSTMRFPNCEVKRNRKSSKNNFGVGVPIWDAWRLIQAVLWLEWDDGSIRRFDAFRISGFTRPVGATL